MLKQRTSNYIKIEPVALRGYSILPHDLAEDPGVSATAKGIWMYLYTRPPGWRLYRTDILKHFANTSSKKLLSSSKELQLTGYLRVTPIKNEHGRYEGWTWHVGASRNVEWQLAAARKFKVARTAEGTPSKLGGWVRMSVVKDRVAKEAAAAKGGCK